MSATAINATAVVAMAAGPCSNEQGAATADGASLAGCPAPPGNERPRGPGPSAP